MATDFEMLQALWNTPVESVVGGQLQAIPLSEYLRLDELSAVTTTTTTGTTITDPFISDGTYTIPEYIGQPLYDPNPWETAPSPTIQPWTWEPATYIPPTLPILGEEVELTHIPENAELIEQIQLVNRHLLNEQFCRMSVKLPTIAAEDMPEIAQRLEAELKMAVIRALRLVPPPQRMRTLILGSEDDD